MKTNYKMLWIDDNFSTLRGDKRELKKYFNKHGIMFEPIEIEQTAGTSVTNDERFIQAVNDIELDVVLVDFNMSGETGADIINHIRKNMHHYHIPILFYSGDGPLKIQEVIMKSNTDRLNISDGIYFCDREDIFRKTKAILDSLIKKEEQPQRVRGLLMDRVSEIDAQILGILKSNICQSLTKTQEEKIKKECIFERLKTKKDKVDYLLATLSHKTLNEIIQYIQEKPIDFDSNTRANLLRNIFKFVNKEIGDTLSDFYNNKPAKELKCISTLRNEYAHQTEQEIFNSHTSDRCKFIREETRRQLENLKNYSEASENILEQI